MEDQRGYSVSLFLDQSLALALRCPICSGVARDSYELECGHPVCSACLDQTRRNGATGCPSCNTHIAQASLRLSKMMQRQVERMAIRCPNAEQGCKWTGTIGIGDQQLLGHIAACAYEQQQCTQCKTACSKDQVNEHMLFDCQERVVACQTCRMQVRAVDYDAHIVANAQKHLEAAIRELSIVKANKQVGGNASPSGVAFYNDHLMNQHKLQLHSQVFAPSKHFNTGNHMPDILPMAPLQPTFSISSNKSYTPSTQPLYQQFSLAPTSGSSLNAYSIFPNNPPPGFELPKNNSRPASSASSTSSALEVNNLTPSHTSSPPVGGGIRESPLHSYLSTGQNSIPPALSRFAAQQQSAQSPVRTLSYATQNYGTLNYMDPAYSSADVHSATIDPTIKEPSVSSESISNNRRLNGVSLAPQFLRVDSPDDNAVSVVKNNAIAAPQSGATHESTRADSVAIPAETANVAPQDWKPKSKKKVQHLPALLAKVCPLGMRCPDLPTCKNGHPPHDLRIYRLMQAHGGQSYARTIKANICQNWETKQCRFKKDTCTFAHGESDAWCLGCGQSGHCANDEWISGKRTRQCPYNRFHPHDPQ